MPVPSADRLGEYARKGVESGRRWALQASEQRAARRLPPATANPGGTPRVLVLTARDWACHVQYEAVVGRALQLRGAHVEFLTCGGGLEICDRANVYEAPPMPCRSCQRYVEVSLDSHGLSRSSIRDGWDQVVADWPELDEVPGRELLEVRVDGLDLGRLVDIPLKWFLCAASLEEDPVAAHFARAFLRSARRIAVGVRAALDRTRPDTVLMLNGLFLFEAVAGELCRQRGIDVVTYERAFRKGTLVFSRGAPAGFYDFTEQWPLADRPLEDAESRELDDYLDQRASGLAFDQYWRFEPSAARRGPRRLVTLFTNLTWDTAVVGRDRAFRDIRSWLDACVDAFAKRPDTHLAIRIHPSELALPGKRTRDSLEDYLHRRYPDLPENITIVGAADLTSSYSLMERSDLGLVYTSTTGLELALHGIPVIVAGETHYRDKGFTLDVDDADRFEGLLDAVLADPDAFRPDGERARRYAHFFFFRAPLSFRAVTEPLIGLARLKVTSTSELEPGSDADLDRICDGILHGEAFART